MFLAFIDPTAKAGRGGALALRGDAGIGKSVLLEYAAATDLWVIRGVGVESAAGLDRDQAGVLLDEHASGLSSPPRQRVLEKSGGDPLVIIELGAAEQDGDGGAIRQVGPLPVTRRVQEAFRASEPDLRTGCAQLRCQLVVLLIDANRTVSCG